MVRPPFGTWVPGNRWDEVTETAGEPCRTVSVIVAHYAQPRQLARTLRAIAAQDYARERIQVVVADDGSPTPPTIPAGVELVRQEDRGFRAAAVRNLGASHARGEILCFLDADTAPEPDYLRRISRLPALVPEAVVAGRRRHADLAEAPVDVPITEAAAGRELPEPVWLADAYSRSRDLRDADRRSYRFVLSAAFACSRWFFGETGGFDESFDAYGGEDWEWAHRAWLEGAVLAHEPAAVAWHDGPDWAGRDSAGTGALRRKNAEAIRLADLIPVAGSRPRAVRGSRPDVVARLGGAPSVGAAFVCVDQLLQAFPAAVVVVPSQLVPLFASDGRVTSDENAAGRARVVVDVPHPFAFSAGGLAELARNVEELGEGPVGVLRAQDPDGRVFAVGSSRRAERRRERWGRDGFDDVTVTFPDAVVLGSEPDVEAYVGGWAAPARLRAG